MFVQAFGKTVIRFDELTEEEARNSDLAEFMDQVAISLVHRHLEKETHIQLDDVRPFTDKYDYMFAMYTNVDAIERHDAIDDSVGISKVVEFMNHAMNHDGHESQLLWWYSWDDLHVVSGFNPFHSDAAPLTQSLHLRLVTGQGLSTAI